MQPTGWTTNTNFPQQFNNNNIRSNPSTLYGTEQQISQLQQRVCFLEAENVKKEFKLQELQRQHPISQPISTEPKVDTNLLITEFEQRYLLKIEEIRQNLTTQFQNELSQQLKELKNKLPVTTMCNNKFVWTVSEVTKKRLNTSQPELSQSFYTDQPGYKIRLVLYLNGFKSSRDKYVSLFVHICYGQYDSIISWPCTTKLRVQLINKLDGRWSSQMIEFGKNIIENDKCFTKPVNGKSNPAQGQLEFISIVDSDRLYVTNDDKIHIVVTEILQN